MNSSHLSSSYLVICTLLAISACGPTHHSAGAPGLSETPQASASPVNTTSQNGQVASEPTSAEESAAPPPQVEVVEAQKTELLETEAEAASESNLSLELSSDRTEFSAIGQSSQLQLRLVDAAGQEQAVDSPVSWSSSDSAIFEVDQQGKVRVAASDGKALITAQIKALELQSQIQLQVAPIVSVRPSSGGGGGGGGGLVQFQQYRDFRDRFQQR